MPEFDEIKSQRPNNVQAFIFCEVEVTLVLWHLGPQTREMVFQLASIVW